MNFHKEEAQLEVFIDNEVNNSNITFSINLMFK